MTLICLGLFFTGLLSAFVLTKYVRDFAISHGFVAVPTQERHLHSSPLPRLGGVAIFLSFCACMGIAALWAMRHPALHTPYFLKTMSTIFVPAAIVFLLSPGAAYITGTCIRVDGGTPNARTTWNLQPHNNSKPFEGFHRSKLPDVLVRGE